MSEAAPAQPSSDEKKAQKEEIHIVREERIVKGPKRFPPRLIVVPSDGVLQPGEVLRMRAVADAFPPASFTWFWNGFELRPSSTIRIHSNSNESTIEIANPRSGVYTVRAENELGQDSAKANMVVEGMKY